MCEADKNFQNEKSQLHGGISVFEITLADSTV